MRTALFLIALVIATIWYSSKAVLAALVRWPRRPGGVYDTAGRDWARMILRAAGTAVTIVMITTRTATMHVL